MITSLIFHLIRYTHLRFPSEQPHAYSPPLAHGSPSSFHPSQHTRHSPERTWMPSRAFPCTGAPSVSSSASSMSASGSSAGESRLTYVATFRLSIPLWCNSPALTSQNLAGSHFTGRSRPSFWSFSPFPRLRYASSANIINSQLLNKTGYQGSTWVYQSYLEPFFRQNEQDLDKVILSAQSNALTFVQSKFQAVWETLWDVINKSPTNGRPGVGAQGQQRPGVPSPHQSYQGQPGTAPSPYDTARQLFNTYAPGALGSLVNMAYGSAPPNQNQDTRSTARPSPKPAASSSSTSFGNGSTPPSQRTPSHTPRIEDDSPTFPQPQFH